MFSGGCKRETPPFGKLRSKIRALRAQARNGCGVTIFLGVYVFLGTGIGAIIGAGIVVLTGQAAGKRAVYMK